MRIIKRHSTKQGLVSLLLAALVGGALIAGSGPRVDAATIGDTLDNSTLTKATDSSGVPEVVTPSGNPWSMYTIPGLNRDRKPSEGSFVKWGYNGWTGASAGMPMSPDISSGGKQAVTDTTNGWTSKTTASPVSVSFKGNVTGYGSPYFSLNYVDKDSLVDFGSSKDPLDPVAVSQAWAGQNLTTQQSKQVFNKGTGTDPTPAKSKMKLGSNGKLALDTDSGDTFDGGYLQATGNVPIQAAVANSKSTVDGSMSGDWAVMVRVQVANGIDAKALAASVDWDKSYYYLTVDSVNFDAGLLGKFGVTINFPLQFDHHIYLDPNNTNTFYLKVKGIPFWLNQKATVDGFLGIGTKWGYNQLQLQDGNADYVDYLHNRQIDASKGTATTLDNFGSDTDTTANYGSTQTSLNDISLTRNSGGNIQPNLPKVRTPLNSVGTLWSLYDLMPLTSGKSPVYETGQLGRMVSMINSISGNETLQRSSGGSLFSWMISGISSYFGNNTFKGNAHINFSFDMSKYSASVSKDASVAKDERALTTGRLFAAPNADGSLNTNSGTAAASDAIKITMYDSSQLVDPYSVTSGIDRNADYKTGATPMQKALHIAPADQTGQSGQSGKTPADYAVINNADLDKGTSYPTYTNITSWTGAVVPYDRMHWKDDTGNTEDTTYTDTMHSASKIQKTGTASPDPAQDGVLINDGIKTFKILNRADFLSDQGQYQPTFSNSNKTKLTKAGAILPQRYANVYQYYDYSTGKVAVHPITTDTTNNLNVIAKTDTNLNGTTLTGSLDGKQWKYTGTMNSGGTTGLPLASATIDLRQSLRPTLNLTGGTVYTVNDTDLAKDGGITKYNGLYRDPLAIAGNDTMEEVQSSHHKTGVDQTARWKDMDVDTQNHNMSFNVANNNPLANLNDTGGTQAATYDKDGNVIFSYKMPTDADSDARYYNGAISLTRKNAISIAGGYSLPANIEGSASTDYIVFRNKDTPDSDWYSVKKYFTSTNQTRQLVQKSDTTSTYGVTADVTSTGKGTNYKNTMTILVPKMGSNQSSANPTNPTIDQVPVVKGTGTDASNTVTSVTDVTKDKPTFISNNYYAYDVTFTTAPKTFTYTYTYTLHSASIPDQFLNKPLTDVIMNDTQMLAQSNAIYFDQWQNVNLLSVPSLDFGKQTTPGASTGGPYDVINTDNTKLEVQDNQDNTSTWSLTGVLGQFLNQSTNVEYSGFKIDLGQPKTDSSGSAESNTTKPAADTSPDDYTNSEWNYVDHTPDTMIANGNGADLYTLNRLYEPDAKSNNLIRYYTDAQLTTPASMNPTITSGKYTSSITYVVRDSNGSL